MNSSCCKAGKAREQRPLEGLAKESEMSEEGQEGRESSREEAEDTMLEFVKISTQRAQFKARSRGG